MQSGKYAKHRQNVSAAERRKKLWLPALGVGSSGQRLSSKEDEALLMRVLSLVDSVVFFLGVAL